MMFILDHPYISDVAINFLIESQCPVLSNAFTDMYIPQNANIVSEEKALQLLEKQQFRWLYSNSENSISWICDKLGNDSVLAKNIDLFKNKYKFRQATTHLFPDVSYRNVSAAQLATLSFDEIGHPFIIKPVVGFISAGVYRVNDEGEWLKVQKEILKSTESVAISFPSAVLNSDFFIIESIIPGDEYAIDAYFDTDGNPVILNILHHKFSSEYDMSDRLYVTSAAIIYTLHDPLQKFLSQMGGIGDFRGMPLHVEVRIDQTGKITPIEVNPLRFAGWCSTDIAYYAYGVNVYDYFINQKKPDWDRLLAQKKSTQYGMGLIERTQDISPDQYFDYDSLKKQFSSVLSLRKIDYRNFPLYGFLFIEVSSENTIELEKVLEIDPECYVLSKNVG